MKNIFFLLLLLSLVRTTYSQDNICESGYMPYKKGLSFELTTYDKKGKESSIANHKITDLDDENGGFKAMIDMEISDAKGKKLTNGSYAIECRDGVIYMDMTSLLDPRSMQSFSSMEMEVSGDALQIPNRLEPGQKLPDGTMNMKASAGGLGFMTMTISVTNRQVGDKESVTTPAGTFDCVKISQETELKAIIKNKYKSTTWYAKGVGMVKSENYDSKGNIESSTVLTKFDK